MDGAGQRHLDRFIQLKNYQRINHFPGMNLLCRKNELGKLLNEMQTKWPGEFDFFPKTWILPRDQRAFEAYVNEAKIKLEENKIMKYQAQNSDNDTLPIFIVKPEAQCQGKGIFLVHDYKDIEAYNQGQQQQNQYQNQDEYNRVQVQQNWDKFHCVVQEYVKKPMLIDRMKFDLRLYVLVLGIDPMRIFLFKDGLARLATTAYCEPTDYNMNNMQMHLTNYAINKNSLGFMKNYTAVADFVGSKRSLKFVMRYVKKQFNADTTKLMAQIKDLTIKTILSAQPHISQNYKNYQIDDYENSLAFEILGFDIMLDKNCKPILLEINHAPSFATDSPIDEKIKGQVIYDTINMLGLSQKRKKNYKALNKLRIDLRRMQSKKTTLTQAQKDQFRKEHDEQRNQFEFRNKGMFEMIYPILDEITLDPWEEKMAPYQNMLDHSQYDYLKKHNLKIPPQLEKFIKQDQKKKTQKQTQKNMRQSPSKGQEKEQKQIQSRKAQQINKIKEYYANIKPKVFTNYDHQSRKLIQKQAQVNMVQTQQINDRQAMNSDLQFPEKEENRSNEKLSLQNNIMTQLEFSDDENPPIINDDQMLADLKRQHLEQQRRSMMSSYNNNNDDGLIFIKSMGGSGSQSRQYINSSGNSSQVRQNQVPQSSLSISKSVMNNNFIEQKGKKMGSRTIYKQNQHIIKGTEKQKQPLLINRMGIQPPQKVDASNQINSRQTSIEQLNRERVNGMINKAHDIQSKMEQLNELNSRGIKPPIQGKLVRPQSSIQPNRKIKIQVNEQPKQRKVNDTDIAGISIQYKDDYNIQGVVPKETDRTAQKRKCQELQNEITSIFYNQTYSILQQKPEEQVQNVQSIQQVTSLVDSKATLSLGDDELRKQLHSPDDREYAIDSEQTAGTASAQGGVSRATRRILQDQIQNFSEAQENYFKSGNVQMTSADLDVNSNEHEGYLLLSQDFNNRPIQEIDMSKKHLQEPSQFMPIPDQSPKQFQIRSRTSLKLDEIRNKQFMRSDQTTQKVQQSFTPDIDNKSKVIQSTYNMLNQAPQSSPFGSLRKSIPNNFLSGQDQVQIMGITAERGGAQRTVEFKTGQIGQAPLSSNMRRRIVPNHQSSQQYNQSSEPQAPHNSVQPPSKVQHQPKSKIPRAIVSAKSRGNANTSSVQSQSASKKQKKQNQIALINGRQVIISEPYVKNGKFQSNWSASHYRHVNSETGSRLEKNKF